MDKLGGANGIGLGYMRLSIGRLARVIGCSERGCIVWRRKRKRERGCIIVTIIIIN